jgi:hypothetical protein
MPEYTIVATCAGETATAVVYLPDPGDTLTVSADTSADPTVTATVSSIWQADTTITIDYGDGTMAEQLPVTDGTATGDHAYTANGTYTITVTGDVTGQVDTVEVTIAGVDDTGTVTVTNTDGLLAVSADIAGLTGDASVTVDWGDGSTPETVTLTDGAATATHDYADASGSPYTVTVTGDTTGGTATDTIAVNDPMVATADDTADPTVTLNVTNIAATDETVTVDWGDA